ncbi:MAG: phosphatase PAP2 family protein [Bacilli bacterium]|nr:phosphatase PAP2 family protein [Bacilli bacterium]
MKKYRDFFILIIFTMGSQALIYFLIKSVINNYNTINSVIDIPLVKSFVYFYDSWYPFIIICAFLIYKYNKNLFYYYIPSLLLCALFAQITFILYPSIIVRPTIEVKNITDWILDFTYRTDTPAINCLPSVHCIYCFITGFYIMKSNINMKYLFIVYLMLIVLSTLFIHQHILEDVLLALLYSIIAISIVYLNKEKIVNLIKIKTP